eukprot:TRINITY_DN4762_c0_g1_i1.p1 TRINITY_DN4762_c0_g1~~TRINITY_DN4762_c0_g1_i1.p1  ORF type:complete len:613 (+),score=175.08 TRINITY_DN4762_c0_g1_i1:93-1841(+)
MLLKCAFLDTLCGKCGLDPDETLAFQTPKMVRINDRVLGGFSLSLTIVIFIYIVYDLFSAQGYLEIEQPTGTTKLSVMLPPFTDKDPNFQKPGCWQSSPPATGPGRCCDDCPAAWAKPIDDMLTSGDLKYCSMHPNTSASCPLCPSVLPANGYADGIKMPCLFWNNYQYVVPSIGRQMLVTTRLKQYVAALPCNADYEGGPTVAEGFRASNLTCIQQFSQYPVLDEFFHGFVAGVEEATVKIDHTVSGMQRHLEKRLTDMHGVLRGCNGEVVKPLPPWDQNRDSIAMDRVKNRVFPLNMLLSAARAGGGGGDKVRCGVHLDQPSLLEVAGKELSTCSQKVREMAAGQRPPLSVTDCGPTIRNDGLVLVVTIHYDNTQDDPDTLDNPSYEITVNALSRTEAKIERVGFVEKDKATGKDSVQYEKRQGILIMVQQTGRIGTFSFKAMLINLTAGLGLLAVSNTVTVLLAKMVCPKITGDTRYYDLLVQESPDFNEDAEASYKVVAKQSAPDGTFLEGDKGQCRWEKCGTKVEIKWLENDGSIKSCSHSKWPNETWYEELDKLPPPPGAPQVFTYLGGTARCKPP